MKRIPRAQASVASVADSHASFSMGSTLVPWLIGLRWAMVGLLAAAVPASSAWLQLPVTWAIAVPTIAALALANLALQMGGARRLAPWTPSRVGLSVFGDMIAIAVVLGASGGAANPFSSLLFVYVALAASLLPARVTYGLAAVAACAFGALFFVPRTVGCAACDARAEAAGQDGAFSSHLYGMWVAFAFGAALVVYFLTRLRRALEELERRADESTKFVALGTLAAGAAHELATPLGTIAILAGELDRGAGDETRASARAITAQVERCRAVIRRMRPGAQGTLPVRDANLGATVISAVETWRAANPEADVVVRSADDVAIPVSSSDVEAALTVLLDNALYATKKARQMAPIIVEAAVSGDGPFMSVADEGIGIPTELSTRLGEPFLTDKEPGEGMGLGLYVVRTLVEQVGGRLEIAENVPRGTRVSLYLAGAAPRG